MEEELICNYRKCRKRLTSFAWVSIALNVFFKKKSTDRLQSFKSNLVIYIECVPWLSKSDVLFYCTGSKTTWAVMLCSSTIVNYSLGDYFAL